MKSCFSILNAAAIASFVLSPALSLAQTATTPYPAEVVTALIEGCIEKGKSREYCSCLFNNVQENMPFEDFVAFASSLETTPDAPPPAPLKQAAAQCISSLEQEPAAQNSTAEYPLDIVQGFINGCQSEKRSVEVCRCTIQNIQATLPLQQFVSWAQLEEPSASIPIEVQNAAVACLGKQSAPAETSQP